jgi:hypothetical protein
MVSSRIPARNVKVTGDRGFEDLVRKTFQTLRKSYPATDTQGSGQQVLPCRQVFTNRLACDSN